MRAVAHVSITPRLYQLLHSGKRRICPKGETVQTSEDKKSFSLVEKGFIKRYLITNDGSLGIQSIYGPGYFFPLTFVYEELFDFPLYSGPETYYYETIVTSEIYSIDGDTLRGKVEADPLLYRDLFLLAGRRLQSNIQRLENMSLHNAGKKVAHQIAHYAKVFGRDTAKGIMISVPLTQKDLAHILSLTRETVSMCVSELRNAGLIETDGDLIVPDLDKLLDEAYG